MSTTDNNAADNASAPQKERTDWRAVIGNVSFKAIVNNIPYLAFLVLLCVLYINNSRRAIDLEREIEQRTVELKEVRWKNIDARSRLTQEKLETKVIDDAKKIGLTASRLPPYKIKKNK